MLFPERPAGDRSLKDLILIACGQRKRSHESEAQYMYVSPLFRKSRDFAMLFANRWYILSAKHGLLNPGSIIGPYDRSLKQLSKTEQQDWAETVLDSLRGIVGQGDRITFVAGSEYRKMLVPALRKLGCLVDTPLEGMSRGRQLKWLKAQVDGAYSDLNRFYETLSDLEIGLHGKRKLGECSGALSWPRRGVYFFFEPQELRKAWPPKQRVVRVGTHAVSQGSSSTLWGRLRAHKGSSDGLGNHRASIFRLHVGDSIMRREDNSESLSSWGKGMFAAPDVRATERDLEAKVSKYLSEMLLLWIDVDDEPGPSSDRAYIERNAISLLSNSENPFDKPTANWLGNYSIRDSIRRSGLWNLQYTMEKYDPRFLNVLSDYVAVTLGRKTKPKCSLAPRWYRQDKTAHDAFQSKLDQWRG